MTDSFWTKVLWSRFIKHFRKLTDEQIINDIHESMDALEDNDASGDSFGAKMVAWANERRNGNAAVASRENGNLGGRPKKNPQDAPHGNAGVDRKSATSCDRVTSDATHREAVDESATVSKNSNNEAEVTTKYQRQRRTGGSSLSKTTSLPPVRQSEPDVLSLAYSGEFQNVRLSQAQYNELGIRFGNLAKLNRAIDSLSCKIENGETNPRNHYAELVKWANYRDDMDEADEVKAAKQPHYETVSEHNARIVAEGKKWIDEHFPKKDNKNG